VLDSPGGDLQGGIMLGAAIRSARVDTVVEEKAICASACTYAFIGGVGRSVLGKFAIHAAKLVDEVGDRAGDSYQLYSAWVMIYTREQIGRDDMAHEALAFGSKGAALLDDGLLRDWNIITMASRPSQAIDPSQYKSLICPQRVRYDIAAVSHIVCSSIALGRLDVRMIAALESLSGEAMFSTIRAEQARWNAYRDSCQDRDLGSGLDKAREQASALPPANLDKGGLMGLFLQEGTQPRGRIGIELCLEQAYGDRVTELEALATYFKIGRQTDVQKGWKAPK
jgi:hypothetical protein